MPYAQTPLRRLVETAGGQIIKRVGSTVGGCQHGEFGEVAVAADDDHALGLGATEEFKETSAFFGEVIPLLRAVFGWDELDAGNNHADFRRFAQAALEPGPLLFAEHGRVRVGVGDVNLGVGGIFLQRRAECPGIEKNDLHSFARPDRASHSRKRRAWCAGAKWRALGKSRRTPFAPPPRRGNQLRRR